MSRNRQPEQGAPQFVEAADGTPIAWRVEGEGPTLIFTNGLANSPFQWGALRARLADRARLVTWDFRGHGDSGPARDPRSVSMPTVVEDLGRVVEAACPDGQDFVLLGYSLGVQVNIEAWRPLSDRIRGMVHVLGTYGRPFDSLYGSRIMGRAAHGLLRLANGPTLSASFKLGRFVKPVAYVGARALGATGSGVGYSDFVGFLEELARVDGASFRALALAAQQHSAADLLPRIDVPVLVISGGRDLFAPPSIGARIADEAPDGQRVHLPRATHTGLLGHKTEICDDVVSFLELRQLI